MNLFHNWTCPSRKTLDIVQTGHTQRHLSPPPPPHLSTCHVFIPPLVTLHLSSSLISTSSYFLQVSVCVASSARRERCSVHDQLSLLHLAGRRADTHKQTLHWITWKHFCCFSCCSSFSCFSCFSVTGSLIYTETIGVFMKDFDAQENI